ncbi:MAG: valine--tRNA ligase, partial [Bacteroidota bacterium]
PQSAKYDASLTERFQFARQVVMAIRNMRQEKNIPQKESIDVFIKKNNQESPDITFDGIVKKLCNISKLDYVAASPEGTYSVIVKSTELHIPLDQHVDTEKEINQLKEELHYQEGFLEKINKKLSNEKFVNNAPEQVVAMEKKKRDDARSRINVIKNQIERLRKMG